MEKIILDKYQQKVIKNKSKNLLVVAGAGSGKTLTIIHKIKSLIQKNINPDEILCITFTKAAAFSLQNKLLKENISLSYENSYLTIKVANKEEKTVDDKEKQSEKYLRRERYYGEMQRSFYIDDIDEANVKAAYKDGILTVTLPKAVKKETATAINID